MRGPLFSGVLGSRALLERLDAALAAVAGAEAPVVVLSTLWLGQLLSAHRPVLLVVEPDKVRVARRAHLRARKEGRALLIALAGAELPIRSAAVSALVVDGLGEMEAEITREEIDAFVSGLVECLVPGGLLCALDATRERMVEARLSRAFLAAGLIDIAQERPRDGALLTRGRTPILPRARLPSV